MKVTWSNEVEDRILGESDDRVFKGGGNDVHVLSVRMHQYLSAFYDCETANGYGGSFTNHRTDRSVPAEVVNENGTIRAWWRKRGMPLSRYIEVHRVEFDFPEKRSAV